MVDKRALLFITLGTLVWASIATGFVSYYYLEQLRYRSQLEEKQQILNELAQNYDTSTKKRNLLSGEYGMLLAEYQWFTGENYFSLMSKYSTLLSNLHGNYSSILNEFPEINTTYNELLNEFQTLNQQNQVTKEEFRSLLDEFHGLFMSLTTKDTEKFLSEVSLIEASLCIDYGNSTIEWHNISISPSATLFDLTKKVADVNYTYWATMEPGHILISSINNHASGYWVWSYCDTAKSEWVFGPVGCDAWMINDNGIYKWECVG